MYGSKCIQSAILYCSSFDYCITSAYSTQTCPIGIIVCSSDCYKKSSTAVIKIIYECDTLAGLQQTTDYLLRLNT